MSPNFWNGALLGLGRGGVAGNGGASGDHHARYWLGSRHTYYYFV